MAARNNHILLIFLEYFVIDVSFDSDRRPRLHIDYHHISNANYMQRRINSLYE